MACSCNSLFVLFAGACDLLSRGASRRASCCRPAKGGCPACLCAGGVVALCACALCGWCASARRCPLIRRSGFQPPLRNKPVYFSQTGGGRILICCVCQCVACGFFGIVPLLFWGRGAPGLDYKVLPQIFLCGLGTLCLPMLLGGTCMPPSRMSLRWLHYL